MVALRSTLESLAPLGHVRCPRPSRTGLVCLALVLVTALAAPRSAAGSHRFFRTFAGEDGLDVPDVRSLAQDTAGFLWIGTQGGLYRYDGSEIGRWAAGELALPVVELTTGPGGRVVALDQEGSLYRVTGRTVAPVPGEAGDPIEDAGHAAFDQRGRLWVIRRGQLHLRERDGAWSAAGGRGLDEELEWVFPVTGRGVFAAGDRALWRLAADGFEKVAEVNKIEDVVAAPGGGLLAMSRMRFWQTPRAGGAVVRITGEGAEEVVRLRGARGIHLAARAGSVWASFDRFLVRVGPDGAVSTLGPEDGIPGGGPLLTDREGSLWLGTYAGLLQFPEPDTRIWGERDGLPSEHTRFLAAGDGEVWVSTWQGMGVLRRIGGGWVGRSQERRINRGELCVTRRGAIWAAVKAEAGAPFRLTRLDGGGEGPRPRAGQLYACHETGEGELWMGTYSGELFVVDPGSEPRKVPSPSLPDPGAGITALTVDREERLWVASGERVCRTPRDHLLRGEASWSCREIAGARNLFSIVPVPSGAHWVSTEGLGVVRLERDGWARIPGSRDLPSRVVLSLIPSPSGGLWVLGSATVLRVVERPDTAAGWEVVERLGGWQGLPAVTARDLIEEPDGTLWLATQGGVVRVPARARRSEYPPPPVELVDVRADDIRLPLDEGPVVPYERKRMELRFAALSFREPSLLRYQVRASPAEEWRQIHRPSFRFLDLPPGGYVAQVRASLDAERWTDPPASYAFSVAPPWWRRGWVLVLLALAAASALYGLYRWRLGFLLKLERQRTRIAMDLHDEMGSGLGSIGILADLLADGDLESQDRTRMAQEIVATAEELGASLSDIVWSLRRGSASFAELTAKLREHGTRLFADRGVELVFEAPRDLPATPLGLSLRRNLLLVGLEALHNARRHAEASRVELAIRPETEGRWRLEVADDGVGIPEDPDGGQGLESMERRAREMGAELRWGPREPRGTRVVLRFSLSRR